MGFTVQYVARSDFLMTDGAGHAGIYSSTLVPNGVAYAIDPTIVGVMLIRRDITVEDLSKPKEKPIRRQINHTVVGLGIVKSSAVAKMTNTKNTI